MKSITTNDSVIHEFSLSQHLIPVVLEELKNIKTSDNTLNQIKRLDEDFNYSYYHKELFEEVSSAFDQVKNKYYHDSLQLEITECWATVTGKFRKHHYHNHPNSIVSAVLYLTDHPESTTNFYVKNHWCWTEDVLTIGKNTQLHNIIKVTPEVGKLVIFPSNLFHNTTANNSNKVRYTLSFNTFISGQFGVPSSHLSIKPLSVKDTRK